MRTPALVRTVWLRARAADASCDATQRLVLRAAFVLLLGSIGILGYGEWRGTSPAYLRVLLLVSVCFLLGVLLSRGKARRWFLHLMPLYGSAIVLLTLGVLQATAATNDVRGSHTLLGAFSALPVIYLLHFLLLKPRAALCWALATWGIAVALQALLPPAVGPRLVWPSWVAFITGTWQGVLILLIYAFPQLRSHRDLLDRVLQSSRDGVLYLQAVRRADGVLLDLRILLANDQARRTFDLGSETSLPDSTKNHRTQDLWRVCTDVLRTGEVHQADVELQAGASPQWFRVMAAPLDDGVSVTYRDITQRKHQEGEMRALAYRDSLTNLANRRDFEEQGERLLREAVEHAQPLLLCFLDLDKFKAVNDLLGHAAGDELLRQVAKRLRRATRPEDLVARFAGDEFALLVSGVQPEGAGKYGARLQAAFEAPFEVGAARLRVRPSIGLVFADSADFHSLLEAADAAMYQAKQQHKAIDAQQGTFTREGPL